MTSSNVVTGQIQGKGLGACYGGQRPDPPIDDYPLLTWKPGGLVVTEDNGTSVREIAACFSDTADVDALAQRFGTTGAHIYQAIHYATRAGFIKS